VGLKGAALSGKAADGSTASANGVSAEERNEAPDRRARGLSTLCGRGEASMNGLKHPN
jgi:hypothetical protein